MSYGSSASGRHFRICDLPSAVNNYAGRAPLAIWTIDSFGSLYATHAYAYAHIEILMCHLIKYLIIVNIPNEMKTVFGRYNQQCTENDALKTTLTLS